MNNLPQPTWKDYVIDFFLSHWKILVCALMVIIATIILFRHYNSSDQVVNSSLPKLQEVLIEGVYYGEYTDVENCEPFPATVTRSSNGTDHYLLSSQGQVYDFWYNKEKGSLTSSALGSGTLEIDTVSNEIIIKFEGWILKH